MRKIFKIWLLVIPMALMSVKCDTGGYRIPYVEIELYLNIVSELGNPIPDSYTLINGGVNGLIVYLGNDDLFHVYDRTCTLYPAHDVAVVPDSNFVGIFTCPECKSKYIISSGAEPYEGPATYPLHEYHSQVIGEHILKVIN